MDEAGAEARAEGRGDAPGGREPTWWLETVRGTQEGPTPGAGDFSLAVTLRVALAAQRSGLLRSAGEATYEYRTPREGEVAERIIKLVGRVLDEDTARASDRLAGREPRPWGWLTGGP